MNLVVDIGNTLIKVAVVESDVVLFMQQAEVIGDVDFDLLRESFPSLCRAIVASTAFSTADVAALLREKGFDVLHFLFRSIDIRNGRNANPNARAVLQQFFEIFENQLVADTNIGFVYFSVKRLDVVEKEIGVRKNAIKIIIGHVSCGIDGGVNTVFL